MTTQEQALAQLDGLRQNQTTVSANRHERKEPVLNTAITVAPARRRIQPIYCPRCSSWVEVKLQPVRLYCTGCGLEAQS